MDEVQFNALADATLARMEQALEACDADLDFEIKPGGVLELEFADGSKAIINRHSAAREIWVAARSGGFHFRHDGQRWIGTRDREELFAAIGRVIYEQAGASVHLTPSD